MSDSITRLQEEHSAGFRSEKAAGLTRFELVWIVALLGLILWLILGTRDDSLEAQYRTTARDQMENIAARLRLEMENHPPAEWNFPLAGPGSLPSGITGEVNPMGDILKDKPDVTEDPWGGAYVLLLYETGGAKFSVLACGGPDGELPEDLGRVNDQEFAIPIPFPNAD